MKPIVTLCSQIDANSLKRMPWSIRRGVNQIKSHAWRYLLDVAHFTRKNAIKAGKILSLHAQAVACVSKGKTGKPHEFGGVFQLGRIKGNFMMVAQSLNLQMNDKLSFQELLGEHVRLLGDGKLKSVATDKGYWSLKNCNKVIAKKITTIGMQKPNKPGKVSTALAQEALQLRNRRAGIEPLIGHVKHGGQLGRSRMKSDSGTLAAGYASIFGFNIRQLINHRIEKKKRVA